MCVVCVSKNDWFPNAIRDFYKSSETSPLCDRLDIHNDICYSSKQFHTLEYDVYDVYELFGFFKYF